MKKPIKHHIDEGRTLAIISSLGINGYGVYWFLEEHLHAIRGNSFYYQDENIEPLAAQIKVTVKDFKKVITYGLKHNFFYLESAKIYSNLMKKEVSPEISEIRKRASQKGVLQKMLNQAKRNGKTFVLPEGAKFGSELPKEEKKPKPQKKVEPIRKVIEVPEPEAELPEELPIEVPVSKQVKPPEEFNKEWHFTMLFNEIKKKIKPKSRGNNILSQNDKRNFQTLIKGGYKKEDFEIVINMALNDKYINEHSLDTPEHVLKVANFQRYLNKATSEKKTNFVNEESEEPNFK